MRFLVLLFITMAYFSISSCKQELSEKKISVDALQGRWEMYKALRGKRPTRTLLGTYFDIRKDSLDTNLFAEFGTYPFYYQHPDLYINKNQAITLTVEGLQNDSISFSTQFKGYDFEFYMKKTN